MSVKRIKEVCHEYRHYFIATGCVLMLALLLLLTVVFPYYYQNVKLRFMDKDTNSPIVNTKFIIYKVSTPDSSQLMALVKTDAQGYVRLNMGHIKAGYLLVKNEDYHCAIDISGYTRKADNYFLTKNALKYQVAKDIKAFGEVLNNAGTLEEFKEQMKKHNLEVNYRPSQPDIK